MNAKAYADLARSLLMTFGGLLVAQGITDQQTLTGLIGALTALAAGGWSFTQNDGAVRDLGRSVLMLLGGVAVKFGVTDQATMLSLAGAISTFGSLGWTAYEHKIKPTPTSTQALAFLLLPAMLMLGACNTTGTTIGKLATDKNLANIEAGLAATNALAQSLIANGTIPAKDAPKVQAAIDAGVFAVQQAKASLADGKLDAVDAVNVAMAAVAQIPVIIAEFKSGKP